MRLDRPKLWTLLVLGLHFPVLVWVAWTLPIGPHEAQTYFNGHDIVATLMHMGRSLFPHADFINIRFPFLIIHLINVALFYRLLHLLLKDESARMLSLIIFVLLPGIVSSAVLATSTGIILALYQLFLLFCLKERKILAYAVLPIFLFLDKSSVILYFALLTYALWHRRVALLMISGTLFGLAVMTYGIQVHGKPVNYFVDTVALYAAIFSPLVFLYFFYAMYRILLKGRKSLIWHISFTVLLLSLLLSLRQKVPIADFAPYVIVALPLMTALFFKSYRVRLPMFRRHYFLTAVVVVGVLALNTLMLLFHRPLFLYLDKPKKHFASKFYFPYWCANALKEAGIKEAGSPKKTLARQLFYYGIKTSQKIMVSYHPLGRKDTAVTIRYKNRPLGKCYVSKINK